MVVVVILINAVLVGPHPGVEEAVPYQDRDLHLEDLGDHHVVLDIEGDLHLEGELHHVGGVHRGAGGHLLNGAGVDLVLGVVVGRTLRDLLLGQHGQHVLIHLTAHQGAEAEAGVRKDHEGNLEVYCLLWS